MRPEIECRRPEFTEGCRVKLGDGQVWTFPKPVLRLVPVRKEAGGFEMKSAPPFGRDYQAELIRYLDLATTVEDEASAREAFGLRVSLAIELLTRNYDLTDDDIAELLYVESGRAEDDSTPDMWSDLNDVIFGNAPKPSAVGSDAP